MESDVEKISSEIVGAVTLIMDPLTNPVDRIAAHQKLDDFKNTSPLSAKCGYYLCSKNNPPIVRHCGFQLIDHYIKLHWNEIDVEQKLWIKNSILQVISSGTESVTKEEPFIKDAVSRIVVELIKREWPQQWPSLMEEMYSLCCMGDEQTELVLLVFSRLADDIVQFQNVPDKRRREIYKSLCTHLNDLFAFFWKTLSEKTERYFESKQMGHANDEIQKHGRVAHVTLETISTFVEWVPINYIIENSPLCRLLSKLLEFEDLRMNAVICLLNILERKGKPEERKQLLVFFEETNIFSVISALDVYDERHFLFCKRLLQCLSTLGTNLTLSMVQFDVKEPENLSLFLNCVLLFTKHPSLTLSLIAHSIWLNIFRNSELASSSLVHSMIPTILQHVALKLIKSGYLSKNDCLASKFAALEYDSDEEFDSYYCRLRGEMSDHLRLIAKNHPKTAFQYTSLLLKTLFSGQDWSGLFDCSTITVSLTKCWEATVPYMDAVCTTLWKNMHTPEVEELTKEGLELLGQALVFNSTDLVIQSYALSSISSLFFFIAFCPEMRPSALDKIFSNLTCFKLEDTFMRDVQNLRRHAAALMIKLSLNHPLILMPEFLNINARIQSLLPSNEYLTQFDKCSLLEALMILSNHINDFDKQSAFLKEILSSIEHIWYSPEIKSGLVSPDTFIPFVGLDKPFQENDVSPVSKSASDLNLAICVIRACVKRCVWPSQNELAVKGNFIHPLSDSFGLVLYRNPSAPHIIPMLDNIFQLIKILNCLFDPAIQQKFDPSYSSVTELCESDKNFFLGALSENKSQQPKSACERMKSYIHGLTDACFHTLGSSVENLHIDFYTIPNLPSLLKENLLFKIEYLPTLQLRHLIRLFLRPFFLCCPSKAHDELMSVLAGLCPFMLQKLNSIWDKFKTRYGSSLHYQEELTEAQEIIDDELNRLLSRDYLAFLADLLSCNKHKSLSKEENMDDDNKEQNSPKSLTPLGIKIIKSEAVRAVFICTVFDALRWLDTISNIKAVHVCELLFNHIIADGLVTHFQEANYLLQSVLYGIQELGQHEGNIGLLLSFGVSVYEKLRNQFPELKSTLMNTVACDQIAIQKLEEVLFKNSMKTKNDKLKKEAFRNVVEKIIGKNVGQQYKHEVRIKNLAPLISLTTKDNSNLFDVTVNDDIGLCSLFTPGGHSA